ncbi:U-box domain-containing protein 33-like [Canna indica]|uniref:RING-type E3 ubiquitin transferase n=1 Tax=Canna indica TaxID=4628 RepID=A0AAQ3L0V0_9LILI|nr:U-box domain-containing protein 33-like [Canna indica]
MCASWLAMESGNEQLIVEEATAANDINNGENTIHVAVGKKFKEERENLLWVMKYFPEATIVIIHVHWHSKWVLTDLGVKFQYEFANEQSQAQHREVERTKMKKLMQDYKSFCSERKVKAHHTERKVVLEGIQYLVEKYQIKRLVLGSRSMAKQVSLLRHCQVWHVRKGKLVSTSISCSKAICDAQATQEGSSVTQILAPNLSSNRVEFNETQASSALLNELEEVDETELDNRVVADHDKGNTLEQEVPGQLVSQQNTGRDGTSSVSQEVVKLKILLTEAREKLRQTEQEKVALERVMSKLNLNQGSNRQDNHEPETPHIRQFTEDQLKKATNNFNLRSIIGEGGYGPVYKANLLGNTVAIKMLSPESNQSSREYEQELKVLSMVEHPNIVKLVGVCSELYALVYEYLPHHSLNQRLARGLQWQDRIRIIGEQRSALIYLHTSTKRGQAIVHADLKFSNILLDENDVSRLSDFGTARLIHQSSSRTTLFYRNTNPMGTTGYIDPAFLMSGKLTPQSDIYSFGIVILRLLTGLPKLNIAERIKGVMRKGALRCILDVTAGEWPVAKTKQLLQLALRCCSIDPTKRPSLESKEWKTLHILQEMTGNSVGNFILT